MQDAQFQGSIGENLHSLPQTMKGQQKKNRKNILIYTPLGEFVF